MPLLVLTGVLFETGQWEWALDVDCASSLSIAACEHTHTLTTAHAAWGSNQCKVVVLEGPSEMLALSRSPPFQSHVKSLASPLQEAQASKEASTGFFHDPPLPASTNSKARAGFNQVGYIELRLKMHTSDGAVRTQELQSQ